MGISSNRPQTTADAGLRDEQGHLKPFVGLTLEVSCLSLVVFDPEADVFGAQRLR